MTSRWPSFLEGWVGGRTGLVSLTSLQALHGALAASIGGPDLFAHLLYDRQQVCVGALGALSAGRLHCLCQKKTGQ